METSEENNTTERKKCLNRTMQYGNFSMLLSVDKAFNLFKSYYVVWKRVYGDRHFNTQNGLNRTMQYGNFFVPPLFVLLLFGLNRTMQYGNSFSFAEEIYAESSLNRTMQYGNWPVQGVIRMKKRV